MSKLQSHPLDNSVIEYLDALEDAGWSWTLTGGPGDPTVVTVGNAEGIRHQFTDERGIGPNMPLYWTCQKVGLV